MAIKLYHNTNNTRYSFTPGTDLSVYTDIRKKNIPDGIYFSRIDNVVLSNWHGHPAVDVFYVTIDAFSQKKYLNDEIAADDECDIYYIKERYVYGTTEYQKLEEYARDNFGIYTYGDLDELAGYTELVGICHNSSKVAPGHIYKRMPMSPAELKMW